MIKLDCLRYGQYYNKMLFRLFMAIALAAMAGCTPVENVSEPFTAATFNIKLAPTPTSGEWNIRRDSVAAVAKSRGFDIFGTQEGHFHQLDDISARTGFKYIGKGREDGVKGGETSAIFYNPKRFELLDSGDFWFAETPDKPVMGWDAACKRICSWGKFRDLKTDKKFFFFSLHFDHKGKIARAESAKLLIKKVKEISGGLPFVCVGDFNAREDSEPMKIIFSDKSFKDSMLECSLPPKSAGGTFHNFTGKPVPHRIDYILVSEGIGVLDYCVIRDKSSDVGAPRAKSTEYPSDHFPVAAKLSIK